MYVSHRSAQHRAPAHNPVCEEVGTFYNVMCYNVLAIVYFYMTFTFFELPTFCGILQ